MKLGNLVYIRTGKLDANAASENGKYPFFTCAKEPSRIDEYAYDCECVLVAGNGDLNVKYYQGKFNAYQRTYIIESKTDRLTVPYLYVFLSRYVDVLRRESIGGVIKYIKLGNLTEAEIPLPGIEEQKKIVKHITTVSHLIELKEQELKKLDELVKSRFIEMFGDPITNQRKWEKKSLTLLGNCKNGMNFHQDELGIKINCLGVGDFKNLDKITETNHLPLISLNDKPSKDYMLRDEDIVFVRSNGNKSLVGRCLVVYPKNIPTTFSGFCIRFRQREPKLVNTEYLLAVLKTNGIRSQMAGRGANIQNLNQKILSNVEIPIAPMALQNLFSDFVKSTDKSKLAIQKSLDDLETLKKSLMQKYFG